MVLFTLKLCYHFSLKEGGSKEKGAPKSGHWEKMSRSESCLSSCHFCVVWGKARWPLKLEGIPKFVTNLMIPDFFLIVMIFLANSTSPIAHTDCHQMPPILL